MKRKQPIIDIQGTCFLADVNKLELRQQDNGRNRILFEDMFDTGYGYTFEYCPKAKNLPAPWRDDVPVRVKIPEWVQLDPVGMAQKYKLPLEALKGKTDFEIMVDQEAFDRRAKRGQLPTIDVAGHIFYVDIRMDKLRPKDEFGAEGILFSKIEPYYSNETGAYLIPYNPRTHKFEEPDYDKVTAFPKDLVAVQFPFQKELDPVGWNRMLERDIKTGLKIIGLKSHRDAKIIPWEQTFLDIIIKENRMTKNEQEKKPRIKPVAPPAKLNKGRRL